MKFMGKSAISMATKNQRVHPLPPVSPLKIPMGRHDPWHRLKMAGHHEGWQSEVRRSGGEAPEEGRIGFFGRR